MTFSLVALGLCMGMFSGCEANASKHVLVTNECESPVQVNISSVRAEDMSDQSLLTHLAQTVPVNGTASFLADFGSDGYILAKGSDDWSTVGKFEIGSDQIHASATVAGANCP